MGTCGRLAAETAQGPGTGSREFGAIVARDEGLLPEWRDAVER
jgi:hypothetical protein